MLRFGDQDEPTERLDLAAARMAKQCSSEILLVLSYVLRIIPNLYCRREYAMLRAPIHSACKTSTRLCKKSCENGKNGQ